MSNNQEPSVIIISFFCRNGDGETNDALSTANANRNHPQRLSDKRQNRAKNCTKSGFASTFNTKHGNKRIRQRNDKINGPVKVRGTTLN